MNATIDEDFKRMHEPHWVLRSAFQLLVFGLLFTEGLLALTVHRGLIWLGVPLVLVVSHLMHGALIGLHEAAHGLLRRNRSFNEFDGLVIGTLSLMSFSLYRVVHQTHHAYLATERDYEFWPLSRTTMPRWRRCLAAFSELNLGLIYSPFLFLRAFLCSPFGLWRYFIWMYLAPAILAANLQNWRKYIEHVGMTGDTVNGSTRSIVTNSWMGRLVAFTLLHEPFHGVHHQRAGLPHFVLPQHVETLQPKTRGERAPYIGYRYALVELMRCLADPRVGPQWRTVERAG
jgi:fatty acid desaturase